MQVSIINKNHVIVRDTSIDVLFSYNTLVAGYDTLGAFVTNDWDKIKTTAKYVGVYMDTTAKDIRRRIITGDIRVIDANDIKLVVEQQTK